MTSTNPLLYPHGMPKYLFSAILLTAGAAALAVPPREQSPAPKAMLAQVGAGNSDEEFARAAAEAGAHPLGSLANPVRVAGPDGERAYLQGLRCADGSRPKSGPRSAGGVGAYGSIVGVYALDCGKSPPGKVSIALDMYHDGHVENRPPAGFGAAR